MDLVDTKLEPPHLQRNAAEFQTIGDIAAGSNDGPVLMVNMNGYYPEAGYPDGELYQTYIQGLGPFLQGAGGLLLCRMPVYGQAVGQQRVDEIVFAWYPTHKAFRDLYLAPGAEENFRLKSAKQASKPFWALAQWKAARRGPAPFAVGRIAGEATNMTLARWRRQAKLSCEAEEAGDEGGQDL